MRIILLATCLALWAALSSGCGQTKPSKQSAPDSTSSQPRPSETGGEPLLLSDEEPLLLLDDAPEDAYADPGAADNTRCAVCHLNLMEEELALIHARAGVGCAECHGPSDAHIADESWASGGNGTAPDIMFAKTQINSGCLECHDELPSDPEHDQTLLAAPNPEERCTDCHGEHWIVNRKCSWK